MGCLSYQVFFNKSCNTENGRCRPSGGGARPQDSGVAQERLRARPTIILPRPIRAATPCRHPSDKSRAASPLAPPLHSSQIQSHCRWPPAIRSPANNAGIPATLSPARQPSRRHGLHPVSRIRKSPLPTRAHPPTNPATETFRSRDRRAPTPPHLPPARANDSVRPVPMPWAAYNRATVPPVKIESGASRCF